MVWIQVFDQQKTRRFWKMHFLYLNSCNSTPKILNILEYSMTITNYKGFRKRALVLRFSTPHFRISPIDNPELITKNHFPCKVYPIQTSVPHSRRRIEKQLSGGYVTGADKQKKYALLTLQRSRQ